MTCVARVRKIPRESVETTFKICCARVRRRLPEFIYEPEVVALMEASSTPNDETIYYSGTAFEKTGAQLWTAYNNAVVSLKYYHGLTLNENNLYTIYDAIYLFHGGTSGNAKWNLCNVADTNAAFRLSFSGGWTFNGGGALPNGTNGYANTWWDTLANCGAKRISLGGYTRTAGASGTMMHGTWDLDATTARVYHFAHNPLFNVGSISSGASGFNTRFHAMYMNASEFRYIANGSSVYNTASANLSLINKPLYLGARNNNGASVNLYTDKQLSFYYMTGKVELSQADVLNLNTVVDQLMLDLGRNV